MKLYDNHHAPNPRRVRMFLAEKGIEVPIVAIDIMKGEHKTPEYKKIAPNGLLPALELDDGTVILESVAICRYFEGLHPDPPLMGTDPLDSALVEMWNRRMEFELLFPMAMTFRHTNPMMAQLQQQVPEFGETQRAVANRRLGILDKDLADREFIAGARFTVADITAFTTIEFFKLAEFSIGEDQTNLQRWFDAVASRPSAKA